MCVAVPEISTSLLQALLGFLERVACASGLRYCFVLSTSTMTWFMERGYNETSLQELPSMRQELYNWKRNPKVIVVRPAILLLQHHHHVCISG